MQDRSDESVLVLCVRALREGGDLVGRSLALARAEIDGGLRVVAAVLILAGTVVVLLVAAFFVFLDAIVKALAVLIGSELAAAGIVASPFLAAACVLMVLGIRRIGRATTVRAIGRAASAGEG